VRAIFLTLFAFNSSARNGVILTLCRACQCERIYNSFGTKILFYSCRSVAV